MRVHTNVRGESLNNFTATDQRPLTAGLLVAKQPLETCGKKRGEASTTSMWGPLQRLAVLVLVSQRFYRSVVGGKDLT